MDFLIVGLGNPGKEYTNTRHNAGWLLLDWWLESWRLEQGQPLQSWQNHPKTESEVADITWLQPPRRLLKPQTFMNESGRAVQKALKWFNISAETGAQSSASPNIDLVTPSAASRTRYTHLIVVHDDLDLELGTFKLQFGRGPKHHNGLLSISQHIGTDAFWSVRVGVDNRQGDRTLSGRDYVLKPLLADEKATLHRVANETRTKLEQTVLMLQ